MSARAWIVFGMIGLFGAGGAAGQLQPGYAIATCFSGNLTMGPVIGVYDITDPVSKSAPLGITNLDWMGTPKFHWTRDKFEGNEIFGIALDEALPSPNVYVTSTTIYNSNFSTLGLIQFAPATGKVYRINGGSASGPVVLLANLPQDTTKPRGQGLGNIAYDAKHQQLFVSNFYDGKIYRLKTGGPSPILDAFDPFQSFGSYANTPGGFAELGERIWGVGVFRDRLYFARWGSDLAAVVPPNGIFSVALDSFGKPSGGVKDEKIQTYMPVSDIEFAPDGRMLLAERSMRTLLPAAVPEEAFSWAHRSSLFERVISSGAWQPSSHLFHIGQPTSPADSSAGGADYVCPAGRSGEHVVATGDALITVPIGNNQNRRVYGLQISPSGGGDRANSYLVDLNGQTLDYDKTEIGDVDVYNTCDRKCSGVVDLQVKCATNSLGVPIPGKYNVSFSIENRTLDTVYHAFLVGLPGATQTHFTFPSGLLPGKTIPVTTMITGGTAGQQLTFQVTLHDQDLNECCATWHTITLPNCDCAQVLGQKGPFCKFFPFGSYSYSFTLQNLNLAVSPAFVIVVPQSPSSATISPAVSTFTPNTQTVPLTISGVSGGQQVCFLVSLHTSDFERCCSIRHCVTVPKCFEDPWWPIDDTIVTLFDEGLVLEDSGGDPGATLILPAGTTAFDVSWSPEDAAYLAVGGTLEQSVTGTLDGGSAETVARLVTTRTATGAELRASFPESGATRHRFEFYLDGERTGVVTGVGPDVPAICSNCGGNRVTTDAHFSILQWPGVPASQENAEPCSEGSPHCVFAGFTFKRANRFDFAGLATPFEGDEVRVFPEDGAGRIDSLTSATVQAHGLPTLTLVDFRTDTDCNGNGVPDYDEITRAGGLDLDLDGVLDACAAPVPLAISLSSGFDDAAGTVLEGGETDADWTFVSPGPPAPAVVVSRPNVGWAPALPGSGWVSVEPETGRSLPGVRFLHFERTFCLTEEAKNLVLDLALRADDRASVRLNGQMLAGPGGGFASATPLAVQRAGAVGDGLFVVGSNRLEVEVRDPGGVVTGFDLAGSLTGPAGACSEP